jgi:hypothetical protein
MDAERVELTETIELGERVRVRQDATIAELRAENTCLREQQCLAKANDCECGCIEHYEMASTDVGIVHPHRDGPDVEVVSPAPKERRG